MGKTIGENSPADALLRGLKQREETKAESKPKKQKNTKAEAEAPKARAEGKKKERKKYYRINLALTEDLGQAIKAEADKQNRSVNNYIETILQEYLREEN